MALHFFLLGIFLHCVAFKSVAMIGFKLSVFCLYALRVVGPVLVNASYFDDNLVKPTLLVCTYLS